MLILKKNSVQFIKALETLVEVKMAGFGDFWKSTLCFRLRESFCDAQKGKDVKDLTWTGRKVYKVSY